MKTLTNKQIANLVNDYFGDSDGHRLPTDWHSSYNKPLSIYGWKERNKLINKIIKFYSMYGELPAIVTTHLDNEFEGEHHWKICLIPVRLIKERIQRYRSETLLKASMYGHYNILIHDLSKKVSLHFMSHWIDEPKRKEYIQSTFPKEMKSELMQLIEKMDDNNIEQVISKQQL